ncbi:type 2 lantibiotic biosynthesis protein LanM [Streptomyces sp. cf124]|uniref:type 2 lanthipeptide synthetase LanM n=1 Tax=Streptomyces sp. cf124 TaxID=1761903 RepID=UPI0008DFE11C|nr:type 2 lanthipeptide synthetase LanM [Streptomyces sp. cf124]SFN93916.1 type 2 lantibiotic biosynthesis protein LanM [Streptomyces sp. cf124]
MTEPKVTIPAFLPFYLSLIPRDMVAARLRARIAEASDPEYVELLIDQVWADLVATVEGHSFRMLIGEFHDFRDRLGLPMAANSNKALQLFRRRVEDSGSSQRLISAYPVLKQRLETVLRNSLNAFADLFTAYAQDRTVLRANGLLSAGDDPIAGLFGTGADLHNNNRKVVGVKLAGGAKVVFKPRALISDHFVRDLYTAADPHLTYSLRECVPASVTIGTHGWQQFVTPRPMNATDQPARYYYRFGALCALFGAIGASDLHDENLLAAGEMPCVIDTETMIRPNAGVDNDSLPHVLINQLKLSVVSTMLVPMNNPNSPIDLIMAGVGIDGQQTSRMKRPVVRDSASDSISVQWERVTHRHTDNVPRLGDTALSPLDHFDEILLGYTDALGAVRDDAVAKVLDSYTDMPVRCLIRSTMVYTRFLDAATHPDYLRRTEEAERLFRLLGNYPDYLAPEAAAYVGEEERASLNTGNVPYFAARGGSTELVTPTSRFPGVHRTSPLDFARSGLALNARRSGNFHHFLLEECFGEVAGDDPVGVSAGSVFAEALRDARPEAWWPRIARTIASVGVSHEGPYGLETGWVCGIGPDRNAPTVTPGNFVSFHDVGGIVTFLANAARYDDNLRDAALGANRGLDVLLTEYGEVLAEAPEGVFTGGASLLLTRPSKVDRVWLERVLDTIHDRAAAGTLDTDLANGPAGVLMVLLSRLEAGEGPLVDQGRLARLRQLVSSHEEVSRTFAWFDVAHGDLGMRWASSRIGRVLDDSALVNASADWLTGQLADAEAPPVPGWCKGTAGLLLTSAEILSSAGRQDLLTGARLATLVDGATRLPTDQPVDLSVCHGSSGVIQSLIATGQILGDKSLLDRATEYQERVLAAIRSNGFHTGSPGRTSLLGYMFGWSGIGDTDIMLHAARTGVDDLSIPVALSTPHPSGELS